MLSNDMDAGATLSLANVNDEEKWDGNTTFNVNQSTTNSPYTVTAQTLDENAFGSILGIMSGASAARIAEINLPGTGADWDYDATIADDPIDGIDNDSDGLIDEDDAVNATKTEKGMGFGGSVDTHYKASDITTLVARITIATQPLDVKNDYTQTYAETVTSPGALDYVAVPSTNSVGTRTVNRSIDESGDVSDTSMGLTLGGETNLKENVKLGYGVIAMQRKITTSLSATDAGTYVSVYDDASDGFSNSAATADQSVTIVRSYGWNRKTEQTISTIQLPIGLEMRPWKKFAVRIGATHQIQTVDTKNERTIRTADWQATDTATGGTATTTYSDPNTWLGANPGPRRFSIQEYPSCAVFVQVSFDMLSRTIIRLFRQFV